MVRRDATKRDRAIRRAQDRGRILAIIHWTAPRGDQEEIAELQERVESAAYKARYMERGRRG